MHYLSKRAIVLALSCGLSACASIVGGTHQNVTVRTQVAGHDVVGANCTVSNQRGSQNVTTPGAVAVHRDSGPLDVQCVKDGEPVGGQQFNASVRGMVWGNLLFGGLIGIIVDFSNGAAHHYSNTLTVMSNSAASLATATGTTVVPGAAQAPGNGIMASAQPVAPAAGNLASLDRRISPGMFNAAQNVASEKQCDRSIRVLMADGQRALLETSCPAAAMLQIECSGSSCMPVHPAG